METEEKREFNPYYFCCICGEPNLRPKRYQNLIICKDCFLTREDEWSRLNLLLNKVKEDGTQ